MHRHRSLHHALGAAAVAAFTVLAAAPAAASPSPIPACTVEDAEASPPAHETEAARGEKLRVRAFEAMEERGDAKEAAELLEASIALRPACDVELFDDLRLAARLHHAAGKLEKARLAMLRAAEHGMATGHVIGAAHAYLDAATIALERELPAAASEAVRRADLLSTSPLLDRRDRDLIAQRIVREGAARAAVGG